jgi:hypothetical protein
MIDRPGAEAKGDGCRVTADSYFEIVPGEAEDRYSFLL